MSTSLIVGNQEERSVWPTSGTESPYKSSLGQECIPSIGGKPYQCSVDETMTSDRGVDFTKSGSYSRRLLSALARHQNEIKCEQIMIRVSVPLWM
jgi:hypothetical protein